MYRLPVRSRFSGIALAVAAAVVALALSLGTAPPAGAQLGDWCGGDPILLVNGRTVNVVAGVIGSPDEVRAHVRHAHFRIVLPAGVDAAVIGYDGDFFTESAEIVFDDALTYAEGEPIEMRVEVTFEGTRAFPAAVYVSVDGESRQIVNGVSTSVLTGTYHLVP